MHTVYLTDKELKILLDFLEYNITLHNVIDKRSQLETLKDIRDNLVIQKDKNY